MLSLQICVHTCAHIFTGIISDTITNRVTYTHREQVSHHRPPRGKVTSFFQYLWERLAEINLNNSFDQLPGGNNF